MGIYSFKPKFIGQLLSKRIPYQVYTAYISADENNNLYAVQELENTIGPVTFSMIAAPGLYGINLPYSVPRLKIVIPGFSDYNNQGVYGIINANAGTTTTNIIINPDFGTGSGGANALTNVIQVGIDDGFTDWRTAFQCGPTGDCTSYPIEIRVYN